MIMYTVHYGLAPSYIIELVSTVAAQTSRPGLRSAGTTNYVQPWTRTQFGERAFSYAGPVVWNSLPDELRRTPTINSFKRKLKTYLFTSVFLFLIFIFLVCILTFVLHRCNRRTKFRPQWCKNIASGSG